MALNDRVLELDLTANRSDCMHMIGVAYELAALYDRPVKLPKAKVREIKEAAEDYISVQVDHAEETPFYQALVIKKCSSWTFTCLVTKSPNGSGNTPDKQCGRRDELCVA